MPILLPQSPRESSGSCRLLILVALAVNLPGLSGCRPGDVHAEHEERTGKQLPGEERNHPRDGNSFHDEHDEHDEHVKHDEHDEHAEHDEHDEHGHAEHFVPAHRPHDFPSAVPRLRQLVVELATPSPSRREGSLDARTELHDIVRWLPELAADSDLPKEPWDEIDGLSRRMLAELDGMAKKGSDVRGGGSESRNATLLELVQSLERLSIRHASLLRSGVGEVAASLAVSDDESPEGPVLETEALVPSRDTDSSLGAQP